MGDKHGFVPSEIFRIVWQMDGTYYLLLLPYQKRVKKTQKILLLFSGDPTGKKQHTTLYTICELRIRYFFGVYY
jgi:hypothetical protein